MTQTSRQTIQTLLASVIDYAGLFPPAKLDMATTVNNYSKCLESDEQWMLGRLIVPISRLQEFETAAAPFLPNSIEDEPWQISALIAPASDVSGVQRDLAAIHDFNERYASGDQIKAVIDAVELKAERATDISEVIDHVPDDVFPFFELSLDRDPRGLIAALVEGDAGAKVRTGGTTADLYPSPVNLARFIAACAAATPEGVPFKATAGMHHPLRHHSDAVNADEFGFLNVFIAGCMAHAHQLPASALQQILEERSIDAFAINDAQIRWHDVSISIDEIEFARDVFAVSFGSCSFDEPLEDLRTLGLL